MDEEYTIDSRMQGTSEEEEFFLKQVREIFGPLQERYETPRIKGVRTVEDGSVTKLLAQMGSDKYVVSLQMTYEPGLGEGVIVYAHRVGGNIASLFEPLEKIAQMKAVMASAGFKGGMEGEYQHITGPISLYVEAPYTKENLSQVKEQLSVLEELANGL